LALVGRGRVGQIVAEEDHHVAVCGLVAPGSRQVVKPQARGRWPGHLRGQSRGTCGALLEQPAPRAWCSRLVAGAVAGVGAGCVAADSPRSRVQTRPQPAPMRWRNERQTSDDRPSRRVAKSACAHAPLPCPVSPEPCRHTSDSFSPHRFPQPDENRPETIECPMLNSEKPARPRSADVRVGHPCPPCTGCPTRGPSSMLSASRLRAAVRVRALRACAYSPVHSSTALQPTPPRPAPGRRSAR